MGFEDVFRVCYRNGSTKQVWIFTAPWCVARFVNDSSYLQSYTNAAETSDIEPMKNRAKFRVLGDPTTTQEI